MEVSAFSCAAREIQLPQMVNGRSTRIEGYGLQYGTLRANWGYGAAHDGERYEVHLCCR